MANARKWTAARKKKFQVTMKLKRERRGPRGRELPPTIEAEVAGVPTRFVLKTRQVYVPVVED